MAAPVKVPGGEKAPKDKVRAFNWKKLPNPKVTGTFFGALPLLFPSLLCCPHRRADKLGEDFSVPGFKIDYDNLEAKFAMKAPAAKAEGEGAAPAEAKKRIVTIIDPKTAQNLNIWVNKYKKLGNEAIAKTAAFLNPELPRA